MTPSSSWSKSTNSSGLFEPIRDATDRVAAHYTDDEIAVITADSVDTNDALAQVRLDP